MGEGELRREVADHYGRHSERYQRFENPRSQIQATPLLDALPLSGTARILDIGTGPGTLVPVLEQRARGATIAGVDASTGALARAVATNGPRFAAADSLRLPVRNGTIDIATFSFSLFHLPSPEHGLREARRVLRRGGAVGILTHDGDAGNRPAEARALVVSMAEQVSGFRSPPPVDETASRATVEELLERVGFGDARVWTGATDEEHDRDGVELLARARSHLPDLSPQDFEAFAADVREQLAALPDEAFRFRLGFVYAVAVAV